MLRFLLELAVAAVEPCVVSNMLVISFEVHNFPRESLRIKI